VQITETDRVSGRFLLRAQNRALGENAGVFPLWSFFRSQNPRGKDKMTNYLSKRAKYFLFY